MGLAFLLCNIMPKRRGNRGAQSSSQDRRAFQSALTRAPAGPTEMITRVLTKEATVSSSSGGTINAITTWDASTFGDFATFAPLYDEWRPLGMRVRFVCNQAFAPPATAIARLVVVSFDNDDAATALTSYGNALDYHNHIEFGSVWDNAKFPIIEATALSQGDPSTGVLWTTTATTNPNRSFKHYSTGLTGSTNYYEVVVNYVVQFRQPT